MKASSFITILLCTILNTTNANSYNDKILSLKEMVNNSTNIAQSNVVEINPNCIIDGIPCTIVSLIVNNSIKGNIQPQECIKLVLLGGLLPNGNAVIATGSTSFSINEEVVVFMNKKKLPNIGDCFVMAKQQQGKFIIKNDNVFRESYSLLKQDENSAPVEISQEHPMSLGSFIADIANFE